MKIGFFGNTNNYPFMLARTLRQMGHEVLFIIDSHEKLYRPEYRYDDISYPYPDWICDVSRVAIWDFAFPTPKHSRIVSLLKSCDAVILNGLGHSLSSEVGLPAISLITGTDLEYYASLQTITNLSKEENQKPFFLRGLKKYLYTRLISAQRAGIRSAVAVSYFARGLVPQGDALLEEIGVQDSQRILSTMTDVQKITPAPLPHNQPVRTFCATRLTWKKPLAVGACELDYKASDIMIRGLGLFARTTKIPLDIRLVKKGRHVAETMQLVKEEGLTGVTWLEEMSQLDVLAEYRQADIIFEQFGLSVVGMAGLDAMAMGRPVIANARPEIMEKVMEGVSSPICHATTPEEVCDQLKLLVSDPSKREQVGLASRRYVEQYFSVERKAKICLERLAR